MSKSNKAAIALRDLLDNSAVIKSDQDFVELQVNRKQYEEAYEVLNEIFPEDLDTE